VYADGGHVSAGGFPGGRRAQVILLPA
jgi:hypothetical protein